MCILELFESSGQKKEHRIVSLTKMDFLKGFWRVLNEEKKKNIYFESIFAALYLASR